MTVLSGVTNKNKMQTLLQSLFFAISHVALGIWYRRSDYICQSCSVENPCIVGLFYMAGAVGGTLLDYMLQAHAMPHKLSCPLPPQPWLHCSPWAQMCCVSLQLAPWSGCAGVLHHASHLYTQCSQSFCAAPSLLCGEWLPLHCTGEYKGQQHHATSYKNQSVQWLFWGR